MGKEIREVFGGPKGYKQLTFGPEWCGPSVAEGKDKVKGKGYGVCNCKLKKSQLRESWSERVEVEKSE